MAHELLGLNNGRVVLSEMPNGEVTLSGSEDRFFDDNKFQNFGDLGAAIRDLIQRFAKEHKVRTDVKSIADMQCKYLDKFYLHGPTLREIETTGLLKKLTSLVRDVKIKRFGVNTHELFVMKKISTGIYEDMSLLLIDYNLLQQDRGIIFDNCRKNNIEISCGNSLCQGTLIQSPLELFFRNRNFFYLLRFI